MDKIERIGAFIHQGIKAQRAVDKLTKKDPPMPDIPPGLPEEFHEDWEFIRKWYANEPCSKPLPEYFARSRAALERLATERLKVLELSESWAMSPIGNDIEFSINTLRELLRERMEKCPAAIRWVTTIGGERLLLCHEVPLEEKCNLCRRDQASLEGKP